MTQQRRKEMNSVEGLETLLKYEKQLNDLEFNVQQFVNILEDKLIAKDLTEAAKVLYCDVNTARETLRTNLYDALSDYMRVELKKERENEK